MMMKDHAADLVTEFLITRHDDQGGMEDRLIAFGEALKEFFGGGTFHFDLTLSDAPPAKKGTGQ